VLWREAVTLDWRLLWRSLQQSSGELWAVIALALTSVTAMGERSVRLGTELAAHQVPDSQAALLVGLQLWTVFAAAFAFVLLTGQLAFMRRLRAHLSLSPVSRWQTFVALQAISVAGRHSLALLSVGLPALILLGTWLNREALVTAIAAVFILMRLPVPMLTIGSRVAAASLPVAIAAGCGLVAIVGALWLTVPDLLMTWLPPFLVAGMLTDGGTLSAWTGLLTWTLALAAIDFWTMDIEPAPVPAVAGTPPAHERLPAAIVRIAYLTGCMPVLLHGELLRLGRWRRHQISWLMCAVLMVLFGSRMPDHISFLRVAILLMLPVHVCGSTLANMFAVDRGGFVAMVMSPLSLAAVMRAKVIAMLLFALAATLASVMFLAARGAGWPLVAAGVVMAAGFFAWNAATGVVSSVLFPSASDPQTVGGSIVNTPAALLIMLSAALYLGPALRLAYLLDNGRVTAGMFALAVLGLLVLGVAAVVMAFRRMPRLATVRIEPMVAALTAGTGRQA
jgi:hypothetical protein